MSRGEKLKPTLCRLLGFSPDQVDDNTKLHGLTFGALLHTASAAWLQGEAAEREACAALHENIDPACDHERGKPGAGAMGAIIRYRDAIWERAGGASPESEK